MAQCKYCGKSFIFGGVTAGNARYCDTSCQHRQQLLDLSRQIPEATVQQYINNLQHSSCPKCSGPGPLEVHRSYWVWSALAFTRWGTNVNITCHGCASRKRMGDMFTSLLFGWWGFPWGFLITPVQLVRNIGAMMSGPASGYASPEFEKVARIMLAQQVVNEHNQRQQQQQHA